MLYMLRKILLTFCVSAMLILCSCTEEHVKYTASFVDVFDSTVTVVGYADNQEAFDKAVTTLKGRMTYLDNLYDIYNNYDSLINIKTVNDNAGKVAVAVPQELFDLIKQSIEWYDYSHEAVNIAIGPVLRIWHDFRESGEGLPEMSELEEAKKLCNIKDIILDEKNLTVFLAKEGMSLDVGAVAKGYATGLAVSEVSDDVQLLVSAGGNVAPSGLPSFRDNWNVGIQDPDAENPLEDTNLFLLKTTSECVVTSGDYQRYYTVNGVRYCHIIDPKTLFPSNYFRAVTIIGPDSGLCDLLSTTAFILPYEEGLELINKAGYNAVWVLPDGTTKMTDGIQDLIVE